MILTKEQILATAPPMEAVEWGDGTVMVAAMTGRARDAFERENVLLSNGKESEYGHLANFRARLLVRCIVSETGERLFSDDDAERLGSVWCEPLDKAFVVARAINGYSTEDVEAAEKNS